MHLSLLNLHAGIMFRHILLYLIICCLSLCRCYIHIIKFNRDINVIIRLLFQLGQKSNCLNMARYVRIDVSYREPIQTNVDCSKISPFVCGNISTNSVARKSRYIPLSISQPEPRSSTEKVQLFIRFYYYSDSNIKVKSSEEPPSSQPCPFFLQKQVNGYF